MRALTIGWSVMMTLAACQGGGGGLDGGAMDATGSESDAPRALPDSHPADGEVGVDHGRADADSVDSGAIDAGAVDSGGPPLADAILRFEPRFGAGAGREFPGGWAVPFEDGPIVVLLCAPDDLRCEAPLHVREIAPEESDGDPIMGSFGPQIEARLPAGAYQLLLMIDSPTSRALGLGWQDAFFTRETAWGGLASEWDLLMTAPDAMAEPFEPLPPAPLGVTLHPDSPVDLGVVEFKHLHERDWRPTLRPEAGVLAVATTTGLRLIDGETWAPVEAVPDSGVYEFTMLDAAGDPLDGRVCGLIRGAGSTVYVLFESTEDGAAGFAVPFDVQSRQQGAHRVLFPTTGRGESLPCRGIAHTHAGRTYLFVTNAPTSMVAGADEGVWYAALDGLTDGDVVAGVRTRDDDPAWQAGVNTLAADADRLYLSVSATPEEARLVPDDAVGRHAVFVATFDSETGAPRLRANDAYTVWPGPAMGAGYAGAGDDVPCVSDYGYAGIAVAPFHDGRTLLFLGTCAEVAVFDAMHGERLDYNGAALPGRPGIDATRFGQAFTQLALSPDGNTLWALPQQKSPLAFFIERGPGGNRQTFNRLMLMPIDLTTGDRPAVSSAFAGSDLDDHAGPTDLSPLATPADDPGVDLNYAAQVRYQLQFLPDSAGTSFQSASFPIGHTVAVANDSVWLRGSGAPGSGLGKGGDLAAYDLHSARAVLFPHDGHPFYRFWLNGVAPEERARFGFDLTPDRSEEITTRGLVYLP